MERIFYGVFGPEGSGLNVWWGGFLLSLLRSLGFSADYSVTPIL